MTDRYADLERLHRLKESGALSEDEFVREKQLLLATPVRVAGPRAGEFWGMDRDTFAMFLQPYEKVKESFTVL